MNIMLIMIAFRDAFMKILELIIIIHLFVFDCIFSLNILKYI